MMLIEGMKRLKVIEKRMTHNSERINQYAAIVSTEKPIFGTEKEQRDQVNQLIQANGDLAKEYLELKRRVDYTNLTTEVSIGKEDFTIADLLQIKRSVANLMKRTYQSLNDRQAEARIQTIRGQASEKPPHVERMYDENDKYAGLQYWQNIEDEIEQRLEVINATTELLEIN